MTNNGINFSALRPKFSRRRFGLTALGALGALTLGTQANATAGASRIAADGVPVPSGFTSEFANVSGVNIHYVISKPSGPPILLLHGWPEFWLAWRDVMPLLAQGGHTVIAADLRGYGCSDMVAPYDRPTMAGDMTGLMAQLMAQLGYTSYVVVGHDWGASVAYQMAVLTGAVQKLIAIEGSPIGSWLLSLALPYLKNLLYFYGLFEPAGFVENVIVGRPQIEYFLDKGFFRNPDQHVVPLPDDIVGLYLNRYLADERFAASVQPFHTILGPDGEIALVDQQAKTPLAVPILGIGGQEGSGSGEFIAQSWEHVGPNVTAKVVTGAGHFAPEEQPLIVAQSIGDFL